MLACNLQTDKSRAAISHRTFQSLGKFRERVDVLVISKARGGERAAPKFHPRALISNIAPSCIGTAARMDEGGEKGGQGKEIKDRPTPRCLLRRDESLLKIDLATRAIIISHYEFVRRD